MMEPRGRPWGGHGRTLGRFWTHLGEVLSGYDGATWLLLDWFWTRLGEILDAPDEATYAL